MGTPSQSLSTLRPDLGASLEEFDLVANRVGFIASRVLGPAIDVSIQSGIFGNIPREQLLRKAQTERASASGYKRSTWTFKELSFATHEHGQEVPVDDRNSRIYGNFFDSEMVSARLARDIVLRNMESRVASLIFNTGTWTGGSLTTAVGNVWDVQASATPVDDVKGAMESVYDGTGIWPNVAIMSQKAFMDCRLTDQIRDHIASSGSGDPNRVGAISEAMVAEALGIDGLIVGRGTENTADEGQTASISEIWDDDLCMVAKIAETPNIEEPSVGRLFHFAEDGSEIGAAFESYRDETVRSDIVRARMDTDEKVIDSALGHLLTGLTS